MVPPYAIDLLRLIMGLVFLGVAALLDIGTRKVKNDLWFGMLIVGLVILEGEFLMKGAEPILLLTPVPVGIMFFLVFLEGDLIPEKVWPGGNRIVSPVLLMVSIVLLWYIGDGLGYDDTFWKILHMPIIFILAYLFYGFGLLRGGADAKAFMCLAVMTPFYPHILGFPVQSVIGAVEIAFPFAFVILINSAVLTLLIPVFLALYNLTRRDIDGKMFLGYRMDLEEIPDKFVWLMQRVKDGEVVTEMIPSRMDEEKLRRELRGLRREGIERPWVNPKIPFMVPMFAGYLLSFLLGNLILGLMDWIISL